MERIGETTASVVFQRRSPGLCRGARSEMPVPAIFGRSQRPANIALYWAKPRCKRESGRRRDIERPIPYFSLPPDKARCLPTKYTAMGLRKKNLNVGAYTQWQSRKIMPRVKIAEKIPLLACCGCHLRGCSRKCLTGLVIEVSSKFISKPSWKLW